MMQRLKTLFFIVICFSASPSHADSWAPPKTETYLSPDQSYRLRIIPRPLSNALDYFSDKVKGREPAGAPSGGNATNASATVEHNENGNWLPIWKGALANEIAPVDAIVTNTGRVITFDNWHSVGYGPNVVVIYGPQGHVIRKMALTDLLPAEYVEALPHSVSSIRP